jgi:SAM-dependent methyltransferase
MLRFSKVATPSRRQGNRILLEWCAPITGRVLSLGSGNDSDKQGGVYRDYFRSADSYETSEVGGEGCDLNLDVRDMASIPAGSYDALFCHSVLEHVDDFYSALNEFRRVLKPEGTLLLGVPFRYCIHRAPQDFWRFTEHGIRYMLRFCGLQVDEVVGVDGPENDPAFYWVKVTRP